MRFVLLVAAAIVAIICLSANRIEAWGTTCYYYGELRADSACISPGVIIGGWIAAFVLAAVGAWLFIAPALSQGRVAESYVQYDASPPRPSAPAASTAAPTNSLPTFDFRRWQTLLEVDSDLRAAAEVARQLGPTYENQLAEKYLALNDKAYLNAILDRLRADAGAKQSERDQLTRQAGETAATNLMSLRDILAGNDNVDKVTGQRVRSTEIYAGPALSFSGGVLIEFEDGAAEIRSGGLRRPFKNRTEALAWG